MSLPWTADHLVLLKSSLEKEFGFCSIASHNMILLIWGWCYGTHSSVGPSDLILAVVMDICTLPSKENIYAYHGTPQSYLKNASKGTQNVHWIECFQISIPLSPLYFTQERTLIMNYFQSKHISIDCLLVHSRPVHILCRHIFPMMSENK